jgi:hypothetical protein
MSYDNTNRGVLFKNDRKEKETHADYRGNINVDGVEFWLDAWIKESQKDGKKFMSLSIKPKQPKVAAPTQPELSPSKKAERAADFDDPIPF